MGGSSRRRNCRSLRRGSSTSASNPGTSRSSRTNGIGLPNYQSGWFRLANGSAALLFVTDWSRAVVVPTTEHFDLLVSPADPQAFLTALNRPNAIRRDLRALNRRFVALLSRSPGC